MPSDAGTTRAAIVSAVCAQIAAGQSVSKIFRDKSAGLPDEATFWRWLIAEPDLRATYEAATVQRGEKYAEEIVGIADSASAPLYREDGSIAIDKDGAPIMVADRTSIEHAKLRVDARKWVAARMLPKRYGDRTVIAGDADNPLAIVDQSAIAGRLLPELIGGGTPKKTGEPDTD